MARRHRTGPPADKLRRMLSYRHAFHAGNFADVVKHVVLAMLLEALQRKEKPFFYLDTHAGAGRYDLDGPMAQKNREYESGIARLWQLTATPRPVALYLSAVRACNRHGNARRARPRWYPGSPRIARGFLRARDRMLLTELHPTEAPLLKKEFAKDTQVTVRCEDGYDALKAYLPPRERRGLVFIDPSFERRNEIELLAAAIAQGYRRWPSGIYAVWYPIMPKVKAARLHRALADGAIRKILLAELCVRPDCDPLGLNGAGMLIINPPWRVADELASLLPWLLGRLAPPRKGQQRCLWLAPE